jgi:hypothetical protein
LPTYEVLLQTPEVEKVLVFLNGDVMVPLVPQIGRQMKVIVAVEVHL